MKALLLAAAAMLLLVPTATGQRLWSIDAEALTKLVRQYDKNGDGKVQKAEYPRTAEGFANLDRDGNGVIDRDDLAARAPRAQPQPLLRRPQQTPPKVGDAAPDFDLPMLGMKDKTVKLSSFRGDRPVALIFGSYT